MKDNDEDDDFLVPFFGDFEPEVRDLGWKMRRMDRDLRNAQLLYNRKKIIEQVKEIEYQEAEKKKGEAR